MSDAQLKQKLIIKRRIILAVLLYLVAVGLGYFRMVTGSEWEQYQADKQQEESVQMQVDMMNANNNQLLATIEENGKQLVSFSEDKIKYINLASELSLDHEVRINKLTVSDVWQEGEMSVMTASIEVEGSLHNVREFVEEYCGSDYTNRINVVSCRPTGRYAWLKRTIDGDKVLQWFDLSEDVALYETQKDAKEAQERQAAQEFGIVLKPTDAVEESASYVYDPETGKFIDALSGVEVSQEALDQTPITLDKMFAEKSVKVYLVIDFLGRV